MGWKVGGAQGKITVQFVVATAAPACAPGLGPLSAAFQRSVTLAPNRARACCISMRSNGACRGSICSTAAHGSGAMGVEDGGGARGTRTGGGCFGGGLGGLRPGGGRRSSCGGGISRREDVRCSVAALSGWAGWEARKRGGGGGGARLPPSPPAAAAAGSVPARQAHANSTAGILGGGRGVGGGGECSGRCRPPRSPRSDVAGGPAGASQSPHSRSSSGRRPGRGWGPRVEHMAPSGGSRGCRGAIKRSKSVWMGGVGTSEVPGDQGRLVCADWGQRNRTHVV